MIRLAKKRRYWFIIIFAAIFLFLFLTVSSCITLFTGINSESLPGNVAVIPIKGVILSEKGSLLFEEVVSSPEIIRLIEKADNNDKIKAIVFEINSPGGSAVASDEIGQAVKKTKKPTVAWIRELGASGGYWIASASDHIIANRMSITGSIGVISSYLEFSGFLDRYNITYQRLVSGKYKDLGSPYKPLEFDEKQVFQEKLDTIHSYFIDEVAANRNLSRDQVAELATGIFYLGVEAKEFGLVDELGGETELKEYMKKTIGTEPEFVEYKSKITILDMISQALSGQSFFIGKGIGSAMFSKARTFERMEIFT